MNPTMLRALPRQLATYARVGLRSGLYRSLTAQGAARAARTLAQGQTGPSAVFRIHAANVPERVAFEFDGRAYTYGAVEREVQQLAAALRARGFGRGDAALLVLKNRPETLLVSAALSRLGAAGVTASWRSTPKELAYLLQHAGARAVFFEAELAALVYEATRDYPRVTPEAHVALGGAVGDATTYEALLASADPRAAETVAPTQEGAVVIYTSGTTGRPKGAVRRFGRGQVEGFFSFLDAVGAREGERHLAVCPLYHSTALGFVGMTLIVAGTVLVEREFEPRRFLDTLERERIETTALVPTLLHRLMALPDEAFRGRDLSRLRAVYCGGAQLPGPLALRAIERLGPVLYNFYGATETGLVTLATAQDLLAAPGTIGKPLEGVELRLLDDAGEPVPDGAPGELFTRNAMLVEGYHDDEQATRASVRDGFFSVGDLALRDAAGRYFIVGRKRDMVISGGVNVYPAEVEAALDEHPGVAQSAVVGVPDDEWGERLRAFVVPRAERGEPLTAAELAAFARARLAGPKVPREWVLLDALPSNPTGKVLKRELREYRGPVERAR